MTTGTVVVDLDVFEDRVCEFQPGPPINVGGRRQLDAEGKGQYRKVVKDLTWGIPTIEMTARQDGGDVFTLLQGG